MRITSLLCVTSTFFFCTTSFLRSRFMSPLQKHFCRNEQREHSIHGRDFLKLLALVAWLMLVDIVQCTANFGHTVRYLYNVACGIVIILLHALCTSLAPYKADEHVVRDNCRI